MDKVHAAYEHLQNVMKSKNCSKWLTEDVDWSLDLVEFTSLVPACSYNLQVTVRAGASQDQETIEDIQYFLKQMVGPSLGISICKEYVLFGLAIHAIGGGSPHRFKMAFPSTGEPIRFSAVISREGVFFTPGGSYSPVKGAGGGVRSALAGIFPGMDEPIKPTCCGKYGEGSTTVGSWVMHLNDIHKLPREDIADRLETLEVDLRARVE